MRDGFPHTNHQTLSIAKTKTLIADLSITKEPFAQLDPSFFDEHFSDHRRTRRKR